MRGAERSEAEASAAAAVTRAIEGYGRVSGNDSVDEIARAFAQNDASLVRAVGLLSCNRETDDGGTDEAIRLIAMVRDSFAGYVRPWLEDAGVLAPAAKEAS